MQVREIFGFSDGSALWYAVFCMIGFGLLFGILLRWFVQRNRIYRGSFYQLCQRPRSTDLIWVAAFNECEARFHSTNGDAPFLLTPLSFDGPSGSKLTIASTDRRSTIVDGRDAVAFSFYLPSCSLCSDIPPPELGGVVWSDGAYNFTFCFHNEPVHGEFASRFARSCRRSAPFELTALPVSSAAAAAVGPHAAATRASSPPPVASLSSIILPRKSVSLAGALRTSTVPSLSPPPILIPSSPDSDSDASSGASNWQVPSWAASAAVERAARAQEVTFTFTISFYLLLPQLLCPTVCAGRAVKRCFRAHIGPLRF
jgi:hypothetical protein